LYHTLTFLLTLCCSFIICGPYDRQYRRRRQDERQGQSDYDIMERYWREVLPLGFFVNQGASETGDGLLESPPGDLTVRDKITGRHKATNEGSGGGETRRDDIEKPTESMLIGHEKHKIEDNEKIATEETGKLAAKIEKDDKKVEEPATKSTEPEKKPVEHKETVEAVKPDIKTEGPADPGDKTKQRRSVTCQGQKEWLQCDGPYELIKIKNAFWGRDNDYTCTKSGVTHGLRTDKNCAQDESNTMNKVREACDNENVCEVVASGIYFDKADCSDIYKYLTLDWECAPSESRIKETIS